MSERKLLYVCEDTVKEHDYKLEFWGGEVAQVTLIDYPANARQALARTTRGYTGRYDEEPMTEEELSQHLSDLKKTKLGTPAEMLNFVFLVRDVPRSWTHQAVRTRIGAAVVQESTRFIGAKDTYKILVPKTANTGMGLDNSYVTGNIQAIRSYEEMLTHYGVASQDARNLLPHSLLTHMYWSLTLRALMGIYEVRWCCQAEPSTWIPVMKQMKSLITSSCGEDISAFLTAPIMRGQSCGFGASFDRPCEWKPRVHHG
jgi:flavin-dependent thymidylate synthase